MKKVKEVLQDNADSVKSVINDTNKNIPYVKIFNSEGKLVNPITKGDPYNNYFMNRSDRRKLIKKATKHPTNNKKGTRVIVTPFSLGKFIKTYVVKQYIKLTTFKTKMLIHNQIKF